MIEGKKDYSFFVAVLKILFFSQCCPKRLD